MSRSRAPVLVAVALALIALAVWAVLDTGEFSPVRDGVTRTPAPAADPGPVEVVPAPRFSLGPEEPPGPTAPVPRVPVGHPPPAAAGGSADRPREPGFCPEPGEARVAYPRPRLAQLLNERTDELVSRVRLFDGGESEEIRRALGLLNEGGRGADAVVTASRARDRRVEAFDFAGAIAVAAGAAALAQEAQAAQEARAGAGSGQGAQGSDAIVAAALRSAGDEAIVHVLAAHVARSRRDEDGARRALAAAFALDPGEPAVAFALGRALAHTPDEAGAALALAVYVEAYPDDLEAGRLLRRVELRRVLAADFEVATERGVTLRYHPTIPREAARASLSLTVRVLEEAARMLGVTRRSELSVVAYGSRDELRASTCVPGWAGGVYDGTLRLAGPTIADVADRDRVIRHEGLHAALGAAVGPTPYWFNEGLAQRFAHERTPAHRRSWARLRRSGMVIPFPSLDGSFLDIDDPADAGLAYHQSLAMVDLLASRRGERVFGDAVAYLRGGGDQRRLFDELAGARPLSSADLLEFLAAE